MSVPPPRPDPENASDLRAVLHDVVRAVLDAVGMNYDFRHEMQLAIDTLDGTDCEVEGDWDADEEEDDDA